MLNFDSQAPQHYDKAVALTNFIAILKRGITQIFNFKLIIKTELFPFAKINYLPAALCLRIYKLIYFGQR